MKTKEILTYKRVMPRPEITEVKSAEIIMVIIGLLAGRVEIWGMVMPTGVGWALANFKSGKSKNLAVAIICSGIGMILSGIDIYKLRGVMTLAIIYGVSRLNVNLWDDKILPTAVFGATVNFICGAIIFGVMKVPGFDYIMLLIEAVIMVSVTLSLKNLSEIVKRGGRILGDDEAISLYVAAAITGAGLMGINIVNIELSVIFSLYITVFAAKKTSIGIAVTIATVMGVVTGGETTVATLGLYVFSAICCGVLASVGSWGTVIGMGVADAIYIFCSLGTSKAYVGEVIIAAILIFFTPAVFVEKMVEYASAPGQNYYGYSRLAHQKSETDTAISQIEEATKTVAGVIREMNSEKTIDYCEEEAIQKVKAGVCEKCALKASCNGGGKARADKVIKYVINTLSEGGSPGESMQEEFSSWRCLRRDEIINRVCDVMEFYRKNSIYMKRHGKNLEYAISGMENLAGIISRRRAMLGKGYLCYETYSEEIMENLIRNGIKCFGVSVIKNTAGFFEVIAEVDSSSLSFAENIIKEIMRVKMKTVAEEKTANGVLLHLKEKEYYKYDVAVMALDTKERQTGDSTRWFDDGRGYLYCILADGMGSGVVAAKESGWTCNLYEKLIKAGGEPEEVFKLINNVLISGKKNESCLSADAIKINLHSGLAEFTKAGAASAYVKTKKGAEKIGWASLPLGILDILELKTVSYDLSEGGYVVLMSDGVPDTSGDRMEGEHVLRRALEFCEETEPERIAESMLFTSMSMGAPKDDMTVVVVKITKK